MADFDDIDALLSSSLKKAAEPANSAGVADAIRARVDAGDAGASVAGSTAPGWKAPQPKWLAPMIAGVSVLVVVLGILIAVLVWPSPEPEATATPAPTPSTTSTATPTPTPTPTPTEVETEDPPAPPRDTTAPKISAGQWSNAELYSTGPDQCSPTFSDIVVTASDNVQLANVAASSSTPGTKAEFLGFSGGDYTFRFSGQVTTDTQVTVTFTATDDARNTATTSRQVLLRPCVIIIG